MQTLFAIVLISFSLSALAVLPKRKTASEGAPKSKTQSLSAEDAAQEKAIIEKLQTTWDSIRSYHTQFDQENYYPKVGTRDSTTGKLYVVKPNKLTWEAKNGAKQILNGVKVTYVEPTRRGNSVQVWNDITKVADAKRLSFLSSGKELTKTYVAKLVSSTPEIWTIEFKTKDSPPETYIAEIRKKDYILDSLTTVSAESRVKMKFNNTVTNPATPIPDSTFLYKKGERDVENVNN